MKAVRQYIRDLWRRRSLLLYLVTSGLKADTRNTILGYFWWLLDPALFVLVFAFIRVVFLGRTGENLIAFLAVGLVIFQYFAQCLTGSARSITGQAGIISQVYLPKIMFPLGVVLTQLVNFAFGLVVVAIILALSGIVPGPELAWLPFIIVVHTLFNVAVALVMAYLTAFVRDLQRILGHLTRLLRFTAPIIFEADRIPERFGWVIDVNPIAWLVIAYRNVTMYGRTPDVALLSQLGVVSLLITLGLMVFYTYNEHRIIKVL